MAAVTSAGLELARAGEGHGRLVAVALKVQHRSAHGIGADERHVDTLAVQLLRGRER
jgi:hypothetical protein